MVATPVPIGTRLVGPGQPCFVVAEAGVNHDGSVERARQLVDAAADAGADAVKFQSFNAKRLASRYAPKAEYQKRGTSAGESQREMLSRLELSPEAHGELQRRCRERGTLFLSTPFDVAAVDLLDALGVPAFKLGSGEINNLPFLEYVARKGRPLVLSTGMSSLEEVAAAVTAARSAGCHDLVLLHCVSNYPTAPADVNLRAITTLNQTFGVPVGFSDHTLGISVALAAVALGACLVEKHVTLDRRLPGPDHQMSLEPAELHDLVTGIRDVEAALGSGVKAPARSELANRGVARRSLAASSALPTGVVLSRDMLEALRPGTGIPPSELPRVLGRRLRRAVAQGELIAWEDLD